MPEYIVRAHAAPTDPAHFRQSVGTGAHPEYLAQIIINSLFISKGHRHDTDLTLVLEKSRDFSRVIRFPGDSLGSLTDKTESGLLNVIIECLTASELMKKDETRTLSSGLQVQSTSFEHLVKSRVQDRPVFLLDRKGDDIRSLNLADDAVFLLTDHVPMPRKTAKSMNRQGVKSVSLGPVMLHASQCIVLIQNEFDRRALSGS